MPGQQSASRHAAWQAAGRLRGTSTCALLATRPFFLEQILWTAWHERRVRNDSKPLRLTVCLKVAYGSALYEIALHTDPYLHTPLPQTRVGAEGTGLRSSHGHRAHRCSRKGVASFSMASLTHRTPPAIESAGGVCRRSGPSLPVPQRSLWAPLLRISARYKHVHAFNSMGGG